MLHSVATPSQLPSSGSASIKVPVQLQEAEMEGIPFLSLAAVGPRQQDSKHAVRHGSCMPLHWPGGILARHADGVVVGVPPQVHPARAIHGTLQARQQNDYGCTEASITQLHWRQASVLCTVVLPCNWL